VLGVVVEVVDTVVVVITGGTGATTVGAITTGSAGLSAGLSAGF
jgi:hypothetical protein